MDDNLKRCPYCAEEILAAAIKCKHCASDLVGRPKAISSETTKRPVVTIQRTSKSIKKTQLALWALLAISIFMTVGSNAFGPPLLLLSIVGMIITRFARWWMNE